MVFWKRNFVTEVYVDLSIGRVYYKALTNGMIMKARILATIQQDIYNTEILFSVIETQACSIKRKQLRQLSVEDGTKLRDRTKELLTKYGIIKIEQKNVFSKEEEGQFTDMLEETKNKKNALGLG